MLPKGLYARALLIIIMPMVVLQSVVAFMFVERQWSVVNYYLSSAVTREIATLIDVYKTYPQGADRAQLRRIAQDRLGLVVDFLPETQLPPPGPKPFFSQLDAALSDEIRKQIGLPFWIDTRRPLFDRRNPHQARRHDHARVRAARRRLRFQFLDIPAVDGRDLAGRARPSPSCSCATRSGRSCGLPTPPRLSARAARSPNFRPRGAREVRRAAAAFLEMKSRIERAIEQRTTMLAGVSHDLRTMLTRFKLELALLGDSAEVEAIKKDVDEMAGMLEAYLAFARGDMGEQSAPTDMAAMLEELEARQPSATAIGRPSPSTASRKSPCGRRRSSAASPISFPMPRALPPTVAITGHRDHRWLTVTVDDDGPGIPAPLREDVFKPFLRLDDARNQDEGGTGLGLAIARDIARSHGGDITLGDSPLGGLRATVRVPV